jgi:hypothetical protein
LLVCTFGLSLSRGALAASFQLAEEMRGADFFSHFDFETLDDPTHGFVDYVRQSRAKYLGIIGTDAVSGAVRIGVESKAPAYGRGRASVRLSSRQVYTTGLFVIDVNHVPEGNGVWPAFWSFGPDWPNSGEIDIIEGINDQGYNQSTLHSGPGCVVPMPAAGEMTGSFIGSRDCHFEEGYKGCSTRHADGSFGPDLNRAGGGVFAALWTTSAISVWYWPRASVPANLRDVLHPDPSTWGAPSSYFKLGADCSPSQFNRHHLILNTTFCGDWAGEGFVGPKGKGRDACNYFVAYNPKEFERAYWDINFIRTYQVQM